MTRAIGRDPLDLSVHAGSYEFELVGPVIRCLAITVCGCPA